MHRLNHLTKTKYHLLSDGRILAYQEFGDLNGTPAFYCHTTAGSKIEGEFFHETALKKGTRLICIDRPGIGDSSYLPKRTLQDYSKDLAELAEDLEIIRFGLVGWTGGVAYALAVSHDRPNQVLFCIIIAGFSDFRSNSAFCEHIDSGIDKLVAFNHRKYPKLVRFYLNLINITAKTIPQISIRNLIRSVNKRDQAIVTNRKTQSTLSKAQQDSFKEGLMGRTKEILIHYSDWGFKLADIKVYVDIFHGLQDQIVPLLFSQHMHENLPYSQLNVIEEEGHFFPCVNSEGIFNLAAERAIYYKNDEWLSNKYLTPATDKRGRKNQN